MADEPFEKEPTFSTDAETAPEETPSGDGQDVSAEDYAAGTDDASANATAVSQDNLLQKELEESRTKAGEYLEGWQRARAEFMNYKKRVERDQAQTYQNAAGNIAKRYLEVVDDLERALKSRPQDAEGAAWANGIELISRKFQAILESEGITRIDPQGELFDPNRHEAISSEESDEHESGEVIEVLKAGYLLGDRVLRPALVRIAR